MVSMIRRIWSGSGSAAANVCSLGRGTPPGPGARAPKIVIPMTFSLRAGLYTGDRLTGGWRRAETDLRHEPDPGRLHRRTRRRHRLERAAERRTVPVVARPGAGERPVAVRAQAVGDDELLLADRRPAAQRHAV